MFSLLLSVDLSLVIFFFFFFNDTATTEIYTLSLHDALPISRRLGGFPCRDCSAARARLGCRVRIGLALGAAGRSEEHTSELQSRLHLVCRLLLEKKKNNRTPKHSLAKTRDCTL